MKATRVFQVLWAIPVLMAARSIETDAPLHDSEDRCSFYGPALTRFYQLLREILACSNPEFRIV